MEKIYEYPGNSAWWIEMEEQETYVNISKKRLALGKRYSVRTMEFIALPKDALEVIANRVIGGD